MSKDIRLMNEQEYRYFLDDLLYAPSKIGEAVESTIISLPEGTRTFRSSHDIMMDIVKVSGPSIAHFMKYADYEIKMKAVESMGSTLGLIPENEQTLEMRMAAVKSDPSAIAYIENPIKEIQIAAVQKEPASIANIKNPDTEVRKMALEKSAFAVIHVENPTYEELASAAKRDGRILSWVSLSNFSTEEKNQIYMNAIESYPKAIVDVPQLCRTIDMFRVSIQHGNSDCLCLCPENIPEEMKLACLKLDGRAIRYFDNPSEDVQKLAINQCYDAIFCIKKPSDKMWEYTIEKYPEQVAFGLNVPLQFAEKARGIQKQAAIKRNETEKQHGLLYDQELAAS